MIFTLGDSHARIPFYTIPGVITNHLGALTLKRIGNPAEPLLHDQIKKLNLTPNDIILLSFGEIDVRCWVKIHLGLKRNPDLETMLSEWSDDYLNKAATAPTNGAQIGILSVVPPSSTSIIGNIPVFAPVGTDQERALYTKTLNSILQSGAQKRNLLFVDTYSLCVTPDGIMDRNFADSSVHILPGPLIHSLLQKLNLLP